MNKLLLKVSSLLPERIVTVLVRFYVDHQIKRHAGLVVNGLENLECDLQRPYLFVCNHLSNSDGLILNKVLEKEKPIFVAGKKLAANSFTSLGFKIVQSISITPNSPDKNAIKQVIGTVRAGKSILIFPEGTRSRTAAMLEGKKGILLFAKLTKAPIVPIGIWGTEKFMPIQDDLGSENFHDAAVNVRIGQVFELPPKGMGQSKENWETESLNYIMERIAGLLPEEYRGFYGKGDA